MWREIGVIGVWSLALSSPAFAQPRAPEAAFGARESVTSASLSPAGTRVAFLAPTKGQGNALYTVPVDGSAPPRRAIVASGDPERLYGCGWVSESRLACTLVLMQQGVGEAIQISRLVATDIDGGNVKLVTRRDGREARYFRYVRI